MYLGPINFAIGKSYIAYTCFVIVACFLGSLVVFPFQFYETNKSKPFITVAFIEGAIEQHFSDIDISNVELSNDDKTYDFLCTDIVAVESPLPSSDNETNIIESAKQSSPIVKGTQLSRANKLCIAYLYVSHV